MFLVPHSRYVLRIVGASLVLVSGRFEEESDGGVNAHGGKTPLRQKMRIHACSPPKNRRP